MTVTPDKLTTGKTAVSADHAITEALRVRGVPKEALATAVGFVRELADKGLKPIDINPKGQPPFWDHVSIHTQLAPSQFRDVLGLLATSSVRGFKVLINGIPDPDIYHLQVDVNIPR